jgi:hypothetical protein
MSCGGIKPFVSMRALRDYLAAAHGLDLSPEFDREIIARQAAAAGVESRTEAQRISEICERGVRYGAIAVVFGGMRFRLVGPVVAAVDDLRTPRPRRPWRIARADAE